MAKHRGEAHGGGGPLPELWAGWIWLTALIVYASCFVLGLIAAVLEGPEWLSAAARVIPAIVTAGLVALSALVLYETEGSVRAAFRSWRRTPRASLDETWRVVAVVGFFAAGMASAGALITFGHDQHYRWAGPLWMVGGLCLGLLVVAHVDRPTIEEATRHRRIVGGAPPRLPIGEFSMTRINGYDPSAVDAFLLRSDALTPEQIRGATFPTMGFKPGYSVGEVDDLLELLADYRAQHLGNM